MSEVVTWTYNNGRFHAFVANAVVGATYQIETDFTTGGNPSPETCIADPQTFSSQAVVTGSGHQLVYLLRVLAGDSTIVGCDVFTINDADEYDFSDTDAVWSYDGANAIECDFTAPATGTYVMDWFDGSSSGGTAPTFLTIGSSFPFTLTKGSTPDGFIAWVFGDTGIVETFTCRQFHEGVAGSGDPGNPYVPTPAPPTPVDPTVSFDYDGATTAVAHVVAPIPGHYYRFSCDDSDSNAVDYVAPDDTDFDITINDIGGDSPGYIFLALVLDNSFASGLQGAKVGSTNLEEGVAGEHDQAATWDWDGVDTVTVTFTSENGIFAEVDAWGVTYVHGDDAVGNGGNQTLQVTYTAQPGESFLAYVWDEGGTDGYRELISRLFVQDVPGAGQPGNPSTPIPPLSRRFFQGYPWRFLFTNIPDAAGDGGGITTTWAEGLLTSRSITVSLNQSTVIEAAVWGDDRRVNQIFVDDGDPLVAQSNRIVYCFRREGGEVPWVIRAAGILMSPQDQGDTDVPLSHFTAYDPWTYLMGRPAMTDGLGSLPVADGALIVANGNVIIGRMLKNAIDSEGFAFIDAGVTYGGTAFYEGTIEATDQMAIKINRGQSVADIWNAVVDAGNCDIVLTPIYDPDNRPGYTHELNIYALAGDIRRTQVFAWDMLNRTVANWDRMHDGTPGQFINKIQGYAGQGGFPVPAAGPETNAASVAKYLPYWLNQFSPTQDATDPTGSQLLGLIKQQLVLQKQGKRTTTLKPTSGRAPIPLLEYFPGDRCPCYATKRIRVAAAGLQRVQTIPISITDDGIEEVPALLLSPDYRGAEDET